MLVEKCNIGRNNCCSVIELSLFWDQYCNTFCKMVVTSIVALINYFYFSITNIKSIDCNITYILW